MGEWRNHEGMPRVSLERAQAAKKTALRRFRNLETVTGIGITRVGGEYAVKLNLSEPMADAASLPAEIDGVPLRIEVTSVIRSR